MTRRTRWRWHRVKLWDVLNYRKNFVWRETLTQLDSPSVPPSDFTNSGDGKFNATFDGFWERRGVRGHLGEETQNRVTSFCHNRKFWNISQGTERGGIIKVMKMSWLKLISLSALPPLPFRVHPAEHFIKITVFEIPWKPAICKRAYFMYTLRKWLFFQFSAKCSDKHDKKYPKTQNRFSQCERRGGPKYYI